MEIQKKGKAEMPLHLVARPTKINSIPSEPSDAHASRQQPTENSYIKVEIPIDIILSLLRQDELAKLQKYVASYLGKHWQP
jgi:hypothetical protein